MTIREFIEYYTDEYVELELYYNGEYYKTIFKREDITQEMGDLFVLEWEVKININKDFVFAIEV